MDGHDGQLVASTRGGAGTKRKKISDEERLRRCRERNRVHARNTRERKKLQMDELQSRIQVLCTEKSKLKKTVAESSVANILISMSSDNPLSQSQLAQANSGSKRKKNSRENTGVANPGNDGLANAGSQPGLESDSDALSSEGLSDQPITVQQIRRRISVTTQQEEKLNAGADGGGDLQPQDIQIASNADPEDAERLRRERNKLHARKTRVRKKKLVHELERIVSTLEEEVELLRSRSRSNTIGEDEGTSRGTAMGLSDMSMGEMSAGEMGANVLASSFDRAAMKREKEKNDTSNNNDSGSGSGSGNSSKQNSVSVTATTMEVDDSSDSKQSTSSGHGSSGKELTSPQPVKVSSRKRGTGAVVKSEILIGGTTQDANEMDFLAQMSNVPKRRRPLADTHKSIIGGQNSGSQSENASTITAKTTSECGTETNSGGGSGRSNATSRASSSDSRGSGGESSSGQAGDEADGSGQSGSDDKDAGSDPDERSTPYEGCDTIPMSEGAKEAAQKRRESSSKRRSGGASKPFTSALSPAPRASELSAVNLEQHRHRIAASKKAL